MNQGQRFVIDCRILSVECEDGSRESWNVTGYALLPKQIDLTQKRRRFKVYFHSVRRTGVLSLIKS